MEELWRIMHLLAGIDCVLFEWDTGYSHPSYCLSFCKRKERNCDGFSLQKRHGRRKWYIFSDIWNGFSFYEIRGFVILSQTSFFLDKHSYATCIYKVGVKTHEVMMQTLALSILQHCRNLGLEINVDKVSPAHSRAPAFVTAWSIPTHSHRQTHTPSRQIHYESPYLISIIGNFNSHCRTHE